MLKSLGNFRSSLLQEVHPASLGLFRILVGFVFMIQTFSFISEDFIQKHIFDSMVSFKFYYFQFLEPLSPSGMKFVMFLMLISALLIMIGRFFKIAAAIFTLSFTYFWLLDKGYFNNHYYFMSLLGLLLFFTNADAWGSLRGKNNRVAIPYYQVFALKAQIFLVFFIAGINKINYYWIVKFQPMKHILETKAQVNGYDWIASDFMFAFFSWSGMLFDLFIGFLLWVPRFRKIGIIFFIAFNLMNYWLFHDIGEIGFFPLLLLACLSIFLNEQKVASKLAWIAPAKKDQTPKPLITPKKWAVPLLLTYLFVQAILPFRHYLYPDHVDWNAMGQRFAWRMKIMYKDVDMHFYVVEEGSDTKNEVNVGHFLNDKQYTNLMYYPDFIPPIAKYIKEEATRRGAKNPKVVADFMVGFNGDKKVPLVDPKTDLSSVEYIPGKYPDWLLPSK